MKKYFSLTKPFLFTLFICSLIAAAVYAWNSNMINDKPISSSSEQVVYQEVVAENSNAWHTIADYWVKDQKEIMLSFIADKESKENCLGLFNVKSAKILEIKEIPADSAGKFVNEDKYLEKYGDVKIFYVGIDYIVNKESMFYYNGVNYRLAIVVPENGQWKLAEMGVMPQ